MLQHPKYRIGKVINITLNQINSEYLLMLYGSLDSYLVTDVDLMIPQICDSFMNLSFFQ